MNGECSLMKFQVLVADETSIICVCCWEQRQWSDMKIFVRTLTNQKYELDVEASEPVRPPPSDTCSPRALHTCRICTFTCIRL
jgi:hypothetical protein